MKWWGLALVALMAYRVYCVEPDVAPQHRVAEMCGGTERVRRLHAGGWGASARCKGWRLMVVAEYRYGRKYEH